MKYNYHTHLKLCNHANGMTIDYAKKAKEFNFEFLGMSDHAPLPNYLVSEEEYLSMYMNENMTLEEFYNVYLPDVNKDYGIKILKGLETEYVKEFHDFYVNLKKDLDYLILGQHFFSYKGKIIDTYTKLSDELIIAYTNSVVEALDTKLFKVFAHPDLFMFQKDEFDELCIKCSKEILNACKRNDCLVEVNLRGFKYDNKYPRVEFFKLAKELDSQIVVGLDLHDPEELTDELIKKGKDFLNSLDLKAINML